MMGRPDAARAESARLAREGASCRRPRSWGMWLVFASSATLICCALPITLVALGLGAASAALFADLPFLVTLAQHKIWLFAGSGLLLAAGAWVIWRPGRTCPADPELAELCVRADRWNRRWFKVALVLWVIGFAAAYLSLPLYRWLGDWNGLGRRSVQPPLPDVRSGGAIRVAPAAFFARARAFQLGCEPAAAQEAGWTSIPPSTTGGHALCPSRTIHRNARGPHAIVIMCSLDGIYAGGGYINCAGYATGCGRPVGAWGPAGDRRGQKMREQCHASEAVHTCRGGNSVNWSDFHRPYPAATGEGCSNVRAGTAGRLARSYASLQADHRQSLGVLNRLLFPCFPSDLHLA